MLVRWWMRDGDVWSRGVVIHSIWLISTNGYFIKLLKPIIYLSIYRFIIVIRMGNKSSLNIDEYYRKLYDSPFKNVCFDGGKPLPQYKHPF